MNKKELEKIRKSKKEEKLKRKETRKINNNGKSFDDMIAYVDENGMITDTPPDLTLKTKIDVDNILISTPKKIEIIELTLTGTIEYLNVEKGFGFIKKLGSMEKYFFHVNNTLEPVKEGNRVIFESEIGNKGLNAVRISIEKP